MVAAHLAFSKLWGSIPSNLKEKENPDSNRAYFELVGDKINDEIIMYTRQRLILWRKEQCEEHVE